MSVRRPVTFEDTRAKLTGGEGFRCCRCCEHFRLSTAGVYCRKNYATPLEHGEMNRLIVCDDYTPKVIPDTPMWRALLTEKHNPSPFLREFFRSRIGAN